jgi:WhiB family transcriptional regulator, redox-sensing transcriptional regulator
MPRVGRGHQRADGALMFLESLRAGLTPPELPGARCAQRDQDPELWFPANGDRAAADRAKAICRSCPVRPACLEWALAANERTGIWGGTTPNERRALRRAAAKALIFAKNNGTELGIRRNHPMRHGKQAVLRFSLSDLVWAGAR